MEEVWKNLNGDFYSLFYLEELLTSTCFFSKKYYNAAAVQQDKLVIWRTKFIAAKYLGTILCNLLQQKFQDSYIYLVACYTFFQSHGSEGKFSQKSNTH